MESAHRDYSFSPGSSSSDANFPIVTLAILGIVSTGLLLVCYCLFVTKCCLNWRQFSLLRRLVSNSQGLQGEDSLIIYSSTIRNQGLDESVIRAIPTFQFKRLVVGGGNIDKETIHDCAVCLNEFQEDEKLRLLPKCSHAFHIDCIDTWLQSNANCPLCRSSISNTSPFLPQQLIVQNPYQGSHQTTHQLTGGDANVVIEVVPDGDDQTSTSQDLKNSAEISPQSMAGPQNQFPRKMEGRTLSKKTRRFYYVSSMGDECIDVRVKDDQFSINPIRRSFSMDSSSDGQLFLSIQETLQQNPHLNEVSSGSDETSIRIRRSFFSLGHGRGPRNSVIPVQFDS
ncbi:hypothetical protein MRB53_004741 [Persea americana]|uniref:Uncharacterized protein n=1 Tax=Persea americana TaxID=3435 RepID=A0ACC2MC30_PERAE|nr:hypothetical protein MRB53_004741 [Persea americana]